MLDWFKKHHRPIAWSVGTAVALLLYLSSCKSLWKWNPLYDKESSKSYDQVFYIASAHDFATGQDGVMPRSRMPLYPWLMHFFADPAKPQLEELTPFIRLNVTISVLCLAAIFFLLRKPLGPWLAALVTLVTAFRVFVFKAVLVQPEILFYTLYFALFLLMLRYLKAPSWGLAAGGGILAGIAHLTKGSALPMLGIFLVLALVREIVGHWRARQQNTSGSLLNLLRPAAFIAMFVATTGLWLRNSLQEYGSPFYDPNTRYYFWAESPREMLAMQHLGLATGKPRFDKESAADPAIVPFLEKWMPDAHQRDSLLARAAAGESTVLEGRDDILPGFKNWTSHNSWRDAVDRVWTGLFGGSEDDPQAERRRRARLNPNQVLIQLPSVGTENSLIDHNRDHPNGYWNFLRFLAGAAILTLGLAAVHSWQAVRRAITANWLPIAFAVSVFLIMTMSYAWWGQVSNRNRFFLTLYLPLVTCFGLVIRFACAHLPLEASVVWRRRGIVLSGFTLILIACTLLILEDLNDPLNRRNLSNPNDLARQIVQ